MEKQNFSAQWPRLKEHLQKEHPHLTSEDLIYEVGKEEELLERLEKKLGKNRNEIRKWLHLMG